MRKTIAISGSTPMVVLARPCAIREIAGVLDGAAADRWILVMDNTEADITSTPRVKKPIRWYQDSAGRFEYEGDLIQCQYGCMIAVSTEPDSISTNEPGVTFDGTVDIAQAYDESLDTSTVGSLDPDESDVYFQLWTDGGTKKRIISIEVASQVGGSYEELYLILFNKQSPDPDYVYQTWHFNGTGDDNDYYYINLNFGQDSNIHTNLNGACVALSVDAEGDSPVESAILITLQTL